MIVLNDAYRVWSEREHLDDETVNNLQEFIREYLLQSQEDLCSRIKQEFSITVFAETDFTAA